MPTGREKSDLRKTRSERSSKRLLEAATELIADQGYSATTIAQIAQKAGYSHGLVSQRFGSKSDLIRMLATEFQNYFAIDKLEPELKARSGLDALIVIIETYLDAVAGSGTLGRAYYELFGESIVLVPEIHETFVQADRNFRDLLRKTIRAAIDLGEIPAVVDVSAVASVVLSIARGTSMQWLLDGASLDLPAIKAEIRRLFELAFSRSATGAPSAKTSNVNG
ncbi:MAG: helix-turn-helix domain-containing protein [Candidatus Binatus sp.]